MCNLTQKCIFKQGEKQLNFILTTSKERYINDKQSWPFY